MRGCHWPGTGRITAPGSSWPQSTRIVQLMSDEAHRRNSSLLTRRWRELESNLRFRARAGSILPARFVADSLLEEAGFRTFRPPRDQCLSELVEDSNYSGWG
jgi:hypothetical protein